MVFLSHIVVTVDVYVVTGVAAYGVVNIGGSVVAVITVVIVGVVVCVCGAIAVVGIETAVTVIIIIVV